MQCACTFGNVVDRQIRNVNDGDLVFKLEADHVVFCVETSNTLQIINPLTIPNGAISENNFFNAGFAAKEMTRHQNGINQQATIFFKFDEQVIALSHK